MDFDLLEEEVAKRISRLTWGSQSSTIEELNDKAEVLQDIIRSSISKSSTHTYTKKRKDSAPW